MTETPTKTSFHSPRKQAKQHAWDCFFRKGNSLVLIAAALIPLIIYVAFQGLCSMLYFAIDVTDSTEIISVVDLLLAVFILPLAGGLLYIATGLSRGKERHIRDIFFAYTSWRAHIRAWVAFLIPILIVGATVSIMSVMLSMSHGLVEIASLLEEGQRLWYANVFLHGGLFFAVIFGILGLLALGYVIPFIWMVFDNPQEPLGKLLLRSLSLVHKNGISWMLFHCSFVGWLLLSVLTVGILFVLFVIPYYLLAVAYYIEQVNADSNLIDEKTK